MADMTTAPFSPSCERNQEFIGSVLKNLLSEQSGLLLEVGSGTGQHAAYLAKSLPAWQWQPTDLVGQLAGIEMWRQHSGLTNILSPIVLDLHIEDWPIRPSGVDAVFTANTLHIVSWTLVEAFFAGAGRSLRDDGLLIVYGPFNYDGEYTSPSNEEFDQWLKENDPESGIRDFEAVVAVAKSQGLTLVDDISMPANNRCLIWYKGSESA